MERGINDLSATANPMVLRRIDINDLIGGWTLSQVALKHLNNHETKN